MIHKLKGYHIHRQRLYLHNAELLNSETLDFYELLCEQHEINPDQLQGPMHISQPAASQQNQC